MPGLTPLPRLNMMVAVRPASRSRKTGAGINTEEHSIARGALWVLVAMMGVAVSAAIVKWASAGFSSEWLMVVRWGAGLLALLVAWPFMARVSLRTRRGLLQCGVGLSWAFALYAFFVAIRYVPLMGATLLMNTASLFIPILDWLINRRKDPPIVWVGTAIGFLGVVAILRPGRDMMHPMALLALASGLLVALRQVLQKRLADEPHARTTFYSMTIGMVGCLLIFACAGFPVARPDWQAMLFVPADRFAPLWEDAMLALSTILLGLCSLSQPWLLNQSMRYATLGEISPFRYSVVIFAAGFDWLFWDVRPPPGDLGGLALIVLGSALTVWRRRP